MMERVQCWFCGPSGSRDVLHARLTQNVRGTSAPIFASRSDFFEAGVLLLPSGWDPRWVRPPDPDPGSAGVWTHHPHTATTTERRQTHERAVRVLQILVSGFSLGI